MAEIEGKPAMETKLLSDIGIGEIFYLQKMHIQLRSEEGYYIKTDFDQDHQTLCVNLETGASKYIFKDRNCEYLLDARISILPKDLNR